jgi:hypothetical protein
MFQMAQQPVTGLVSSTAELTGFLSNSSWTTVILVYTEKLKYSQHYSPLTFVPKAKF